MASLVRRVDMHYCPSARKEKEAERKGERERAERRSITKARRALPTFPGSDANRGPSALSLPPVLVE
jgi:hypothetical protein